MLPAVWTECLGKADEGVELVVRLCNSNSHLLLQVVLYYVAVVAAVAVAVAVVVVVVGIGADQVSSWES